MTGRGGEQWPPPSPWLLRRIPREVADPRWCGGLSRADLAAALRFRETDKVFVVSLVVSYRRGLVDFCGGYVVPGAAQPVRPGGRFPGRPAAVTRQEANP